MVNVMDWIARSGVVIEGESRELLWKLTLSNVLEKRGVEEAGGQNPVSYTHLTLPTIYSV